MEAGGDRGQNEALIWKWKAKYLVDGRFSPKMVNLINLLCYEDASTEDLRDMVEEVRQKACK